LKPGNTFLEGEVVKIGDYGLSKFISASRRSGQTTSIGTVHYMAPEVAQGRYGSEVDLYAIGVMLYEMLAGRLPFTGESPGEIMMKHLTAMPDLRVIPPAFRPVVARLLDKDPHRRYSSAQALLADLNGYLSRPAGEGVDPAWAPEQPPALTDQPPAARQAMAVALQPHAFVRADMVRARQLAHAAEASWARVFTMAMLLGIGAACFVGIAMYDPERGIFGRTLAWAIGTGASVSGAVLLLAQFFRWAGKFADPDTVRKFQELEGRSGPPPSEQEPRRQGGVPAALGKLMLALFIGAGVGCVVGGGVAIFATSPKVADFGLLLGWGVGMIVFGGTAFGWLFDKEPKPRRKREARGSEKETPISRGGPPQETAPWQPQSERVR
jgi:hypothetical protein